MSSLDAVHGVPGTDAVAAKRGYEYQDVATALAWVALRPEQVLHVEVAEDFALQTQDWVEANQVRNTAASLTLTSALDAIDRLLALREQNPTVPLVYVYRTTSPIGLERQTAHRPGGEAGIGYWNNARVGRKEPGPLISVLRKLAKPATRLHAYLAARTDDTAAADLIPAIVWSTNEPDLEALEQQLLERLAAVANVEFDVRWSDVSPLVPVVVRRIAKISFAPDPRERRTTHAALRLELGQATDVRLPRTEHDRLVAEAAMGRNVLVEPIEQHVARRLERLRRVRFFAEGKVVEAARALAKDVGNEGSCLHASATLRAEALSWCARVLLQADRCAAEEAIATARALAPTPPVRRAEAILLAESEVDAARRLLQDVDDGATSTVRYWLHRRSGREQAIRWLKQASLRATDFDGDGCYFVLLDLAMSEQWEDALGWLDQLTNQAFAECPALLWVAAHVAVALAMPDAARRLSLGGPPVADELRLMDTLGALQLRRRAAELFRRFHDTAKECELSETAVAALQFNLWLRLHDRPSRAEAVAEVLDRYNRKDEAGRVPWIPLALAAQIPIDRTSLTQTLDARAARNGAFSQAEAHARMALLLSFPPEEGLAAWPTVRPLLAQEIEPGFLEAWEIQALASAGRNDEAIRALDDATHLSRTLRDALCAEISVTADAPSEPLTNEDGAIALRARLMWLKRAKRYAEATACAARLFQHTQDHNDALSWLRLLAKAERWPEIVTGLDNHRHLLDQSDTLAALALEAWMRAGRWQYVRELAAARSDLLQEPLLYHANLTVYSGEWEGLGVLIEQARSEASLSVGSLTHFARLALASGHADAARALMDRAIVGAPEDAAVLWEGYQLAVRGRWEAASDAGDWLRRAIECSGIDGPVQRRPLSDFVDMAARSAARNDAFMRGIAAAELPVAAIARALRRPLSTMFVQAPAFNLGERDPARRTAISAFAARPRTSLTGIDEIAVDHSALLTLARLDLLSAVLACFARIHVPQGLGAWLFFERAETQFHQPSRIQDAHALLTHLGTELLRMLPAESPYSRRLAAEVGRPLAQLVQFAQRDRDAGRDAFVVRPAPVFRVTSLCDEQATLGPEAKVFRSCTAVVESLEAHGLIAEPERERAQALFGEDDQFPDDGVVPIGASLYLDDVAVSYFQTLNLWKPLRDAGYHLMVLPEVRTEAQALVESASTIEHTADMIERVRRFFVGAQRVGKLGILTSGSEADDGSGLPPFSLFDSLSMTSGVQAIVVDDRAINRYGHMTCGGTRTLPMATSLDVLDRLRESDQLDGKAWMRHRCALRRSGYLFVPVTSEELLDAVNASGVRGEEIAESQSARAIRENVLLASASEMLRVPDEMSWLMELGQAIVATLTQLWQSTEDDELLRARANWVTSLRPWDAFLGQMPGDWDFERLVRFEALQLSQLVMIRGLPPGRNTAYAAWLEDDYVQPARHFRPKLFAALRARTIESFEGIADTGATDALALPSDQRATVLASVAKSLVNELPVSLREEILGAPELLKRLGLSRTNRVRMSAAGETPQFEAVDLVEAAGKAYRSGESVPVKDLGGATWQCRAEANVIRCVDAESQREFEVPRAPLFHPDVEQRLEYLRQLASEFRISIDDLKPWTSAAKEAPLSWDSLDRLERELGSTPLAVHRWLADRFAQGQVRLGDLVRVDDNYLRWLVPYARAGDTLDGFLSQVSCLPLSSDLESQIYCQLLWSSHPRTGPHAAVATIGVTALRQCLQLWIPTLDLWSLTGLIETVLQRSDASAELHDVVHDLVSAFAKAVEDESRLALTSSLACLADHNLQYAGSFFGEPVFARRMTAIAHAALVERAVLEGGADCLEVAKVANQYQEAFVWGSLADLPSNPRWSPHFLDDVPLKHELVGRVVTALAPHLEGIAAVREGTNFSEIVASLQSRYRFFLSAVPGPLEGEAIAAPEVPETWVDAALQSAKDATQPLQPRIGMLAHLYRLGRVGPPVHSALATLVGELTLDETNDVPSPYWEHIALAVVDAAVSSGERVLVDAVRDLLETRAALPWRFRLHLELSLCGATRERDEWSTAIEALIRQALVRRLTKSEAVHTRACVETLCDAWPYLRPKLASLLARLQGSASRIGE